MTSEAATQAARLPERVPNATYTPDAEIIQEAAALLAQCGPEMDYADCADTALDGICALWGRDEDDKCTGMKTVAVPPEHEDGSAPEWKLLQYAARLTRIAQSQAAALAAAQTLADTWNREADAIFGALPGDPRAGIRQAGRASELEARADALTAALAQAGGESL